MPPASSVLTALLQPSNRNRTCVTAVIPEETLRCFLEEMTKNITVKVELLHKFSSVFMVWWLWWFPEAFLSETG